MTRSGALFHGAHGEGRSATPGIAQAKTCSPPGSRSCSTIRRQQLDDAAIWATDFSSSEDNLGELIIVQHAVASDLLRWQWHAFGRGLIEGGSAHAPAQECLYRLQSFVGGDRRPPLRDGSDDLNDIALANLVDAPAGPGFADLPAKEPPDLATGAVL
jgi:hypothetical protein